MKKPDFVAYIDESGDEGYNIVPPPERKSSEWFVLSSAIYRVEHHEVVELSLKPMLPFHFRKAPHHECVAFSERLCTLPIATISILAHKPSMPENAAIRTRRHYLFDYATKLLVERISWYCDSNKGPGSGLVEIIFSQRRQLKLERVKAYLATLRNMTIEFSTSPLPELSRNSIRWNVIDFDLIDMRPHNSLTGLQVVDAVVSGTARAVEWSPARTTEHRYIKSMRSKFFRYGGKCQSYGIKFIPDKLPEGDPWVPDRFHWLHHFK